MKQYSLYTHLVSGCFLLAILLGCQISGSAQAAENPELSETETLRVQAAALRGPTADPENLTFVTVNGVRLAYRLEGSGIPVVFVHGEGYSHELWTEQAEAFSAVHLFISYDRRGHGSSEDPLTGYSETAHAHDLNALLMHLGIRDAHFVVNSRGGSIIIQFLKMYEDKVRSITFADATIPLVPISEESAFYQVVPYLFAPPPDLEQAAKGREGATTSSFTRVAQSRPEVLAVLQRMSQQYSPLVSMNPQRSDMSAPIHIGPWNDHDFPDMNHMATPIYLLVAELSDVFFHEGAAEAHRLWPNPEFFQFETEDGITLNAYFMKPSHFDPSKKYPVIAFDYGNAGSQMVINAWGSARGMHRDMWHRYMAEQGYIIFSMDNRTTTGRGKLAKNLTYGEYGKWAVLDQLQGIRYLKTLPWVDSERIGFWGWSGGGYLAAAMMTKGAPHYKVGVSVAPVIDLVNYQATGVERWMGQLEENPEGYAAVNLSNFVDRLEGDLLLIHGTGDENVKFAFTLQFADALIKANKQFDMMVYPNEHHGLENYHHHVYTKIANYFKEKL